MELSKRLQAVADLVTPGLKVADIGTDHGYIPIWLMEHKKAVSYTHLIYIGGGKMIHAPKPGRSVEVINVYGSPWFRRYW